MDKVFSLRREYALQLRWFLERSTLPVGKWTDLPVDVWAHILLGLPKECFLKARIVCTKWRTASQSSVFNPFWGALLGSKGPKVIAPYAVHLDQPSKFKCKMKHGKCQTLRHYAKDEPRVSVYSVDSKVQAYRECVRFFARRQRIKLQAAQTRDGDKIEKLKAKMADRRREIETLNAYIGKVTKKRKVTARDDDDDE